MTTTRSLGRILQMSPNSVCGFHPYSLKGATISLGIISPFQAAERGKRKERGKSMGSCVCHLFKAFLPSATNDLDLDITDLTASHFSKKLKSIVI